MAAVVSAAHARGMPQIEHQSPTTAAFHLQAMISFAVSSTAVGLGVASLPVDGWMRAFLAIGVLYIVTSSFTLAKCVRDRHEASSVVHRVDEVRLERILAEHDPFRTAP